MTKHSPLLGDIVIPCDMSFYWLLVRYANRAKSIKNKPKINEDPKDAMIREFKEEIERLRKMLEMQAAGALAGQLSTQLPPPSKSQTVGSDEEGSPQEEQRRATEPVSAPSVDMKPEALDFAALVTEGNTSRLRFIVGIGYAILWC